MATIIGKINLFQTPHLLDTAKNLRATLDAQIKLVEAFEWVKDRLDTKKTINANTVNRCAQFVKLLNDETSDFATEVSKLTLNELMFTSVCFREGNKELAKVFKAIHLRTYLSSRKLNCLEFIIIRKRLRFLAQQPGNSRFYSIYLPLDPSWSLQFNASDSSLDLDGNAPQTNYDPRDFYFNLSTWDMIFNTLGAPLLERIPRSTGSLCSEVRITVPRLGGDPVMTINPYQGPWLNELFPNFSLQASVRHVQSYLGPLVWNEIERSELRQWEKRKGILEYTDCVRIVPALEIQVGRTDQLINKLYIDQTAQNLYHPL